MEEDDFYCEPYLSDLARTCGFYDEQEFQDYCDEQERRAHEDQF